MQQEADNKLLVSEAGWDNMDRLFSGSYYHCFHDFLHIWEMRKQAREVTQDGFVKGQWWTSLGEGEGRE